jgi:hypothetical protein
MTGPIYCNPLVDLAVPMDFEIVSVRCQEHQIAQGRDGAVLLGAQLAGAAVHEHAVVAVLSGVARGSGDREPRGTSERDSEPSVG